MSTVKVVNVQHPSASTAAVTLAADGSMTGAFPAPNRNLLYNGAMQCHQRGTSTASITTSGYYTADRWNTVFNGAQGTWTQSVENDGPTGSGFTKSLKMLCTTADASPAADDIVRVDQVLEGQDLQRIGKGTASAQSLTLSFWVKSNVTGTYIATLQDQDNIRAVSTSYTVSASATWEEKTITFPADTTGAFDNDNAASLRLILWLGAGSNRTSGTLATAWEASTAANLAVGQTNLAAATNNYWQITGVQLEVGPVATAFEFKSFGQELRECQRYYEKSYATVAAPGTATANGYFNGGGISNQVGNLQCSVPMKVTKRDTPAISMWNSAGTANTWDFAKASAGGSGTPTAYLITDNGFTVYLNIGANWVAGSMGGHWVASAEL